MVRRMSTKSENKDQPNLNPNDANPKGERIAKVLARAGVASRREVERMINEGRIRLKGKVLQTPATLVKSLDDIEVDGETINQVAHTKVWRLHKKRGTLTTHSDPEGRPTVFDKVPDHFGRVISVGRLDMNTEGLLLLTNDGALARWLELPENQMIRRYRVRVHGRVNERALLRLAGGITINGIHYGAIDAALERQTGANAWITIAIREGKNREVRRVMEHLGLDVNRLIRTHYGPFSLGTLPQGAAVPVGDKQLYDVLSDYFQNAPQSVASPAKDLNPTKWAKPKAKKNARPGQKRRDKFRAEQRRGKTQADLRKEQDVDPKKQAKGKAGDKNKKKSLEKTNNLQPTRSIKQVKR